MKENKIRKLFSQSAIIIIHYGDPQNTKRCINSIYNNQSNKISSDKISTNIIPKDKIETDKIKIDKIKIDKIKIDKIKIDKIKIDTILIDNDPDNRFSFDLNKNVIYLSQIENIGFAKGVNIGIKKAIVLGKKFVLLLNNDMIVTYCDIFSLLETCKENYCIAGAIEYSLNKQNKNAKQNNNRKIIFAGGDLIWREVAVRLRLEPVKKNNIYLTDFIRGSSMAIPIEIIKDIGFFDENFKTYVEDVDYCIRVIKKGYKLIINPNAIFGHIVSASADSYYKNKFMARNYMLLLKKHTKGIIFIKGSCFAFLSALYSLINKKTNGKFKGFIDGVFKRKI